MSYSTKFASQFYGPFREAAGLGAAVRRPPALSDRRAIAARRDRVERALRARRRRPADGQARHDVDRSDRADRRSDRPAVGAYQVSGEYAGLLALGDAGPDRFRRGAARNVARLPPRRRGVHHHVRRARRASALGLGLVSAANQLNVSRRRSRARALRVTPGGVHSPVRAFRSVGGTPVFFARGAGRAAHRRRQAAATSISARASVR